MKSIHAAFTVFAKPLVEHSRGFSAEKHSRSIHGIHVFGLSAGRAFTPAFTAFTRQAFTFSPVSLRDRETCAGTAVWT
jgi:hypothetical protein